MPGDWAFSAPADVADALRQRLAASNEWVRENFFPELSPTLFRAPKDVPDMQNFVSDEQVTASFVYIWKQKQEQVGRLSARVQTLLSKIQKTSN